MTHSGPFRGGRQVPFITLEGGDGAGKTTQLKFIRNHLEQMGYEVLQTREPGGTPLGEKLRALLLDQSGAGQRPHVETEALLMFAARNEHLQTVILPALKAGQLVLCDRFTDSSFAYQCGGSGMAWSRMRALEDLVHMSVQPDLTFYLDVPVEVAEARRSQDNRQADRFESEQQDFHRRVREAYLERASEHWDRIIVIDARQDIPAVQAAIAEVLDRKCGAVAEKRQAQPQP